MTDFDDETRSVTSSLYVQVLLITVLLLSFVHFFTGQESFKQMLLQSFFKSRSGKLPPGPSAWPILGCLPQFQRASRSAIDLSDWVRVTSEIHSHGPLMTPSACLALWIWRNDYAKDGCQDLGILE